MLSNRSAPGLTSLGNGQEILHGRAERLDILQRRQVEAVAVVDDVSGQRPRRGWDGHCRRQAGKIRCSKIAPNCVCGRAVVEQEIGARHQILEIGAVRPVNAALEILHPKQPGPAARSSSASVNQPSLYAGKYARAEDDVPAVVIVRKIRFVQKGVTPGDVGVSSASSSSCWPGLVGDDIDRGPPRSARFPRQLHHHANRLFGSMSTVAGESVSSRCGTAAGGSATTPGSLRHPSFSKPTGLLVVVGLLRNKTFTFHFGESVHCPRAARRGPRTSLDSHCGPGNRLFRNDRNRPSSPGRIRLQRS